MNNGIDGNETKFSVLMSVYAREKSESLDRALGSVLVDQTLKPSEMVLVADGPLTHELYGVIDKYRNIFTDFKLVQLSRNEGLGRALNAGLEHCSYEWVARMDSDDISLPQRFETQMKYIESHPEIDALGCTVFEFETDMNVVTAIKSCPQDISSYIKFRSPLNHPTVIFRKYAVTAAGGYMHCPYMEDYHLWIRMHAAGMRLTSIPDALYLFKMDRDTYDRRGGRQYVASEYRIQTLLRRKGIISYPRYCFNIIIRCGARLLSGNIRGFIYRKIFRSKPAAPYSPTDTSNHTITSNDRNAE